MKFRIVLIVKFWETREKLTKVYLDSFGEPTFNLEESDETFSSFGSATSYLDAVSREIEHYCLVNNAILYCATVESVPLVK